MIFFLLVTSNPSQAPGLSTDSRQSLILSANGQSSVSCTSDTCAIADGQGFLEQLSVHLHGAKLRSAGNLQLAWTCCACGTCCAAYHADDLSGSLASFLFQISMYLGQIPATSQVKSICSSCINAMGELWVLRDLDLRTLRSDI